MEAERDAEPVDCKAESPLTPAVESAECDAELPDGEPELETWDSLTPALAEALTAAETEDSKD